MATDKRNPQLRAALAAKIRATGVIPARQILTAKLVVSAWDAWKVTPGTTWDEVEANGKTWAQSGALDVVIDP